MGNTQTTELETIVKAKQKISKFKGKGGFYLKLNNLGLISEDLTKLLPFIQKKLPGLISLCLSDNNITFLPEDIGKINNLEILLLTNNTIKSLKI